MPASSDGWFFVLGTVLGSGIGVASNLITVWSARSSRKMEIDAERMSQKRERLQPICLKVEEAVVAIRREGDEPSEDRGSAIPTAVEAMLVLEPMLRIEKELRPIAEAITGLRDRLNEYDSAWRDRRFTVHWGEEEPTLLQPILDANEAVESAIVDAVAVLEGSPIILRSQRGKYRLFRKR